TCVPSHLVKGSGRVLLSPPLAPFGLLSGQSNPASSVDAEDVTPPPPPLLASLPPVPELPPVPKPPVPEPPVENPPPVLVPPPVETVPGTPPLPTTPPVPTGGAPPVKLFPSSKGEEQATKGKPNVGKRIESES